MKFADKPVVKLLKDNKAENFVAGALTGTIEICMTYPIKYVKTQLQLEEKLGSQKKYSGVIDCMRQTVQKHGFFGVYRGLNLFFYGAKGAVRFGTYELMKGKLTTESFMQTSPLMAKFLSGICAGAIEAAIVNTPLEAIECKLIYDYRSPNPRYKSFLHGAKLVFKEEGLRGFYCGIAPSVLKQASNQGVRFFVVEAATTQYKGGDPNKTVPKFMVGIFGGLAGICSVFVNNPIDVIKTRMQGIGKEKYRTMNECCRNIIYKEGLVSFYRGVTPRLGRVAIEVALTFTIYAYVQDILAGR